MQRIGGLQKEEQSLLPHANVLEFQLEGHNKIIIRPSGTEPKIKAYVFTYARHRDVAEKIQHEISVVIDELFK